MRWLCVDAMNDDIKATVALGLLVAPAERSPAFLRAVCDHGTMRRTREIVQIYKTLPRDQHDDVLVNACIVLANVAKLSEPELRSQTLPVDDFVWMIPADKGHMYTTYALEGLAHTWRDDPGAVAGEFGQPAPSDGVAALLKSGGLARVAQYMDGPPLRPKQGGDAAILNQEVARRLFCRLAQRAEPLLAEARELERSIAKEHAGMSGRGGAGAPKTIWQRAGVHRGETELEVPRARLPAPPPSHHLTRRRPSASRAGATQAAPRPARRDPRGDRRARAPRAGGGEPHARRAVRRVPLRRERRRARARCTAARARSRARGGRT